MYIKENIRALMRIKNYTQAELANQVGVARTTVSKWINEKSKTLPNIEQIQLLSDLLGESVDNFLRVNFNSEEAIHKKTDAERVVHAAIEGNSQVLDLLNIDALIEVLKARLVAEAKRSNEDYAFYFCNLAVGLGSYEAINMKKKILEDRIQRAFDEGDVDEAFYLHEELENTKCDIEDMAMREFSFDSIDYELKKNMPEFMNKKTFEEHIRRCQKQVEEMRPQYLGKLSNTELSMAKTILKLFNEKVDGAYPREEREKHYLREEDIICCQS